MAVPSSRFAVRSQRSQVCKCPARSPGRDKAQWAVLRHPASSGLRSACRGHDCCLEVHQLTPHCQYFYCGTCRGNAGAKVWRGEGPAHSDTFKAFHLLRANCR